MSKNKCSIILVFLTLIFMLLSCSQENNLVTFTGTISEEEVYVDSSFDILVTTTNSSGTDYHYEGSSTIIGAIIYLINDKGDIIRPLDVPVTKDFCKMVFKNGDTIERNWSFILDGNDSSGWYHLNFEYFDCKETITNFIYIKE